MDERFYELQGRLQAAHEFYRREGKFEIADALRSVLLDPGDPPHSYPAGMTWAQFRAELFDQAKWDLAFKRHSERVDARCALDAHSAQDEHRTRPTTPDKGPE